MKGHELFARTLRDLGVFGIFGNPGTTEIPLLQSVDRYYLTLHDSISVSMADGYSLFKLEPSAVNLHTMPGVGNSMAFIHTARMNRSPVVVTSGQQDTRHAVHQPLLSGDLVGLVGNSVKWAYEVKNPSDIPISLKRAVETALTPPMGPVFVSFPMDYMDAGAEYPGTSYVPRSYEAVDIEATKTIAERFDRAENPALVFGYEVDAFGAHAEANLAAQACGCPVFIEPLTHRAAFGTRSEQYAGDLTAASTLMEMQLSQNDLALFVGGGTTLYPYSPTPLLSGKQAIFVGFDVGHGVGDSFVMNPKSFLREFAKLVTKKRGFRRKPDMPLAGRIARARTRMGADFVLAEAKRRFEGHAVVDESISYSPRLREIFGYEPNNYFFAKTGALGWGLGAAMGLSLHGRKVLLVVGDGGLMYTVQGLWTMKKYALPVKVLVMNNGGYNILKSYSKSYHPAMESAPFFQLDLDVAQVVKGFGVEAETADKDLKMLDWLKEGEGPRVLVVNMDRTVERLFL